MKKAKGKKPEPQDGVVTPEVTQRDYEEGLERGWTGDDMPKPGRYKSRRGGFSARHPELKIGEKERA